jgi:hypothetical protein
MAEACVCQYPGLSVCVCVCVCACVCVYQWLSVCVCVCVYLHAPGAERLRACACTYQELSVCMYLHISGVYMCLHVSRAKRVSACD